MAETAPSRFTSLTLDPVFACVHLGIAMNDLVQNMTRMMRQATPSQTPASTAPGPTGESFIGKAEAARRLSVKPRTVESWMEIGLPYYKVGRSVRFKWSEIEAYLAATCRVCRGAKAGFRIPDAGVKKETANPR